MAVLHAELPHLSYLYYFFGNISKSIYVFPRFFFFSKRIQYHTACSCFYYGGSQQFGGQIFGGQCVHALCHSSFQRRLERSHPAYRPYSSQMGSFFGRFSPFYYFGFCRVYYREKNFEARKSFHQKIICRSITQLRERVIYIVRPTVLLSNYPAQK